MKRIILNETEVARWEQFKSIHRGTDDIWFECRESGIGMQILAVAKYSKQYITADITNYDSW